MTVGRLFVLFAVKVNHGSFGQATGALNALRAAAKIDAVVNLGRGVAHIAERAGHAAIHIKALSQQMGMSSQQTQEWGYIAEQAGSNVDELSIGMVRLAKNLRALDQGRNTMGTRALRGGLGITRAEAHAALQDPEKLQAVLYKISDAFLRMGNTSQRAGISNEVFGRQAKSMVSDMARGSVELKALIGQINARGAIISNEQVERLAHFGNRIHNIRQELRSFAFQAVAEAAPAMLGMLDAATAWFVANRDLLNGALAAALKAVELAFRAVGTAVTIIADTWRGFVNNEYAPTIVMTVLAYIIMSKVIPALRALAFWMALDVLPFLVINAALIGAIALVAGVIVLVRYLITHWDTVGAAIKKVVFAVGRGLLAALVAIGGVFVGLVKGLGDFGLKVIEFFRGLPGMAGYLLQALGDVFVNLWHFVWGKFVDLAHWAMDKIRNLPVIKQVIDFVAGPSVLDQVRERAAAANGRPTANSPNLTNVPPEFAGARGPVGAAARDSVASVTVGPTTNNFYGVKDAMEAKDHIADSIDNMHRHAAAALNGDPS